MTGMRQDKPPRPARKRRIPPPPPYRPGAADTLIRPYEGLEVLEEMTGDVGIALFQRARDVVLWHETPPEQRNKLFSAGRRVFLANVRGGPAAPLAALAELVSSPFIADPKRVAAACAQVSDWAADQALLRTAREYAEIAARVRHHDPLLATAAGRVARKQADYGAAVQWFDRAIAIARRTRAWSAYVAALISWATLEIQRGNLQEAKGLLIRGWRMAKRRKLQHLKARTRHDLMQVEFELRDYHAAEEHAWAAFEFYGPRATNIFALAHDWAFLWIAQGYFSSALPVLEALRPHLMRPSERILLLSALARANAAVGNAEEYARAAEGALLLVARTAENAAGALDSLAEGAYSLGRAKEALDLSQQAFHYATSRSEKALLRDIEERLQRIKEGSPPERNQAPPSDSRVSTAVNGMILRLQTTSARP